MNEISSSSSLSDTDLEYENNLNFTTSSKKCKSKIRKYQRPRGNSTKSTYNIIK